jgi:hypothetical protein
VAMAEKSGAEAAGGVVAARRTGQVSSTARVCANTDFHARGRGVSISHRYALYSLRSILK